jgi:glutaredoxin/glutathione-dependent peroxiredoxin
MTISIGDRVPAATLKKMGASGPEELSTGDFFAGRKVVLFAVPGAFTPTCSNKHLPGFVEHAGQIKAKGVDIIACMSVNDAFVMDAWGKDRQVGDDVEMLADGSAEFAKAMGLELDLTAGGLGIRSKRFAMVVDDGVVTVLKLEAAGGFDVSSAESILAAI